MNIKTLMKWTVPPIAVDLYKRLQGRKYYWEGIYAHYKDVPVEETCLDNDTYVTMVCANTKRARAALKYDATIPTQTSKETREEDHLLSLLASVIRHRHSVRILDFGGGQA